MEDHYTAVVLKNSNTPGRRRHRATDKSTSGRPASPLKKGARGKSPRKKDASSKGSRKDASKKSGSKSPSKGRKKKGNKGSSTGGRKGKGRGGGRESTSAAKKVYASASAFMEEHFPSEDVQVRLCWSEEKTVTRTRRTRSKVEVECAVTIAFILGDRNDRETKCCGGGC